MQNKIKVLIFTIACFALINPLAIAVGENQIPVSTSYSEVIQSVQNQQNLNPQATQTNAAATTPAHEAVTGSLENATKAIQDAQSEEISPIKKEVLKQTKPKKSYVNVIFKFILAMICVAISSIIIFIILLSYKRLILKGKPITPTYESTEHSLNTPKNFKEAIKLFLDKTKWN